MNNYMKDYKINEIYPEVSNFYLEVANTTVDLLMSERSFSEREIITDSVVYDMMNVAETMCVNRRSAIEILSDSGIEWSETDTDNMLWEKVFDMKKIPVHTIQFVIDVERSVVELA